MANRWTPEQLEAITERGCNLLVAAAAGAGKTAVLVERIIRKITDSKNPVDIDRLLVVTFTNAAAAEMRERVGRALANALEADPSSVVLQRQMALLDRASIMTLHSFCLEVVRNHFQSLDIDPYFRIADETESTLLRLEALDELFEEKYESESADSMFFRLADSYGGRGDDSLRDLVLKLHRFTRSCPWPAQWLAARAEAFNVDASASLSSTPWARVLLKGAAAGLQGLRALLGRAAGAASRARGLGPYCGVLEEDVRALDRLHELCQACLAAVHEAAPAPEAASGTPGASSTNTSISVEAKVSEASTPDIPASGAAGASAPGPAATAAARALASGASATGTSVATEVTATAPCTTTSGAAGASAPGPAATAAARALASGASATGISVAGEAAATAPCTTTSEAAAGISAAGILDPAAAAADPPSGSPDWDTIHEAFASFEPARLPRCGKDVDTVAQEQVKAVRKLVKDKLKKLYESGFDATEAEVKEDFRKLYPLFKYMSSLVCELDDIYLKKKKDKSLLDFNDLEHDCLKVLLEDGMPSSAALELREKYEEILVDEYQDSNLIQELILRTVSGNDDGRHNLFMVGDIKQSIYRFRQARPELFLEKYSTYPHEKGHDSRAIRLFKNFRSRREVIEGVNFIFRQIMSADVGELDYTEEEALNPGAVFEDAGHGFIAGGPVEVHMIDVASKQSEIMPGSGADRSSGVPDGPEDSYDSIGSESTEDTAAGYAAPESPAPGDGDAAGEYDEEPVDNIQAEARIVGRRIKELAAGKPEGFNVYDKKLGKYRPAEYRDIVILMRTTRNWSDVFTDELAAMGIPAYADTGLGYFKTVEVETVLSLLQIIDNPLQDIPMLAVLRSPVGDFDTDELADIRLADRNSSIYEALKAFAGYPGLGQGRAANAFEAENKETCGFDGRESGSKNETGTNPEDKRMEGPDTANAGSERENKTAWPESEQQTCGAREKAAEFLKKLEGWRDLAQYTPTDELIWQLLTETGYYSYMGAMPGGAERQANLRLLLEKARQYEETSYKGLFNFVNFIEKMKNGGGDMGSARLLGESDNVVRIMSIHKSKGLEFPVVIVAGCGKKFNVTDLNAGILLHQDLGYGPDIVDLDKRTVTPTLAKFAIKQKSRLETLSEEMRILYVAFTRAREKLIITGCVRDIGRACAKWCFIADTEEEKLPRYDMLQASAYLDWIGPALARHENGKIIRQMTADTGIDGRVLNDKSSWEIKLWGMGAASAEKAAAEAEEKFALWLESDMPPENELEADRRSAVTQASDVSSVSGTTPGENPAADTRNARDESGYSPGQLIQMLEWRYPYGALEKIPAKLTVTELKKQFAGELQFDGEDRPEPAALFKQAIVEKPEFMEPEKGLGAARKGTIMHFVMQHIDLKRLAAVLNIRDEADMGKAGATVEPALETELEAQLGSMIKKEQLTAAEAQAVNIRAICGFFGTRVGKLMLSTPDVRRETAFTMEIKCAEIYRELPGDLYGNETMLLQGVIDCWFEKEGGLLLLDYKTDYVPPGGSNLIKERYKVQLDYYTRALEQMTGRRVAEKYLYLFYNGELLRCQ